MTQRLQSSDRQTLEPLFESFLREAKVAFNRGTDFGAPGRGFARLNFATSEATPSEILKRMANAVRRLA